MNESTFVVWNNTSRGFIESVGREGMFYTQNLDSAFQFTKKDAAVDLAEDLGDCVVLKWI